MDESAGLCLLRLFTSIQTWLQHPQWCYARWCNSITNRVDGKHCIAHLQQVSFILFIAIASTTRSGYAETYALSCSPPPKPTFLSRCLWYLIWGLVKESVLHAVFVSLYQTKGSNSDRVTAPFEITSPHGLCYLMSCCSPWIGHNASTAPCALSFRVRWGLPEKPTLLLYCFSACAGTL